MVYRKFLLLLLLTLSFITTGFAAAADSDTSAAAGDNAVVLPANMVSNDPQVVSNDHSSVTSFEYKLSTSIIYFGIGIIVLEVLLILVKAISQEYTVKLIVITLIIISTLFLITAGFSNNQIAPAMGLLGTIAGYLLGKTSSVPDTPPQKTPQDDAKS